MGSEISGLDDRHAYLKLGNSVARFDFDYLDLPTPTAGFVESAAIGAEVRCGPPFIEHKSFGVLRAEKGTGLEACCGACFGAGRSLDEYIGLKSGIKF